MISRSGLPFKIRAPLNRLKNNFETKDLDILSLSIRSGIYEHLKQTPLQKA